ncbi:unnamed protein product [Rhizoctonia solani]|uniref:Uncharacterized protein n=1 Tax=Rhizoctonia solani TaxID=456999 RepID=A0A8H3DY22_9AGAM|nr:unnamed protein product [Rhizoctonia solani]
MGVNENRITVLPMVLVGPYQSARTILPRAKRYGSTGLRQAVRNNEVFFKILTDLSSARPTNGKSVSKRTPSPPSDPKYCRPRTPNKPPAQVQPPVMIQRQMKPQELPLLPVGVTETAPYPDHFPTHFSQWNPFFATGIPYTHNNSMTLNGLSHNTALLMDHTMNEPFFDVDPHGQHLHGSASTPGSDTATNEFSYPNPVRISYPFKYTPV